MVATRPVPRTPLPQRPELTPTIPAGRAPSPRLQNLREYLIAVALCGLALGYLALACRASVLDYQLVQMESRLAEARFQALQGKRELVAALSLQALEQEDRISLNGDGGTPLEVHSGNGGAPLRITCPPLPPLKRSALAEVAGRVGIAPQPSEHWDKQ